MRTFDAWTKKQIAQIWAAITSINNGGGGGGGGGSGVTSTVQATEPEGNLTGNIGDICSVVSGGVMVAQRVKTTAGGNTGWV